MIARCLLAQVKRAIISIQYILVPIQQVESIFSQSAERHLTSRLLTAVFAY